MNLKDPKELVQSLLATAEEVERMRQDGAVMLTALLKVQKHCRNGCNHKTKEDCQLALAILVDEAISKLQNQAARQRKYALPK